jgi:hypothetical protein
MKNSWRRIILIPQSEVPRVEVEFDKILGSASVKKMASSSSLRSSYNSSRMLLSNVSI